MWGRASISHLSICATVVLLIATVPLRHAGVLQLFILIASIGYPAYLNCERPPTRFWKGALQLGALLTLALLCQFSFYLCSYAFYQYERLGREFHLVEALSWTLDESFAFFFYLDVAPAVIIAVTCYPLGYFTSWLIARRYKALQNPQ